MSGGGDWKCGARGGVLRKSKSGSWYGISKERVPLIILRSLDDCQAEQSLVQRRRAAKVQRGKLCITTDDRKYKDRHGLPGRGQDRKFIILPLPSYVDPTKLGTKFPIKNQFYYLSTGTSNARNFPGVIFPASGLDEPPSNRIAWIQKLESKPTAKWRIKFCELLDSIQPQIDDPDLKESSKERKGSSGVYKVVRNEQGRLVRRMKFPWGEEKDLPPRWWTESCEKRFNDFLSKFREWFQVQQSAAFGGEFWERADLRYLRDLALGFRWNEDAGEFVPSDDIVQKYTFPKRCRLVERTTDYNAEVPREINTILDRVHALYGIHYAFPHRRRRRNVAH